MKRLRWLKLMIAMLFAASVGVAKAATDKFPPCGTFVLIGTEFNVTPLDFAKPGRTIGDERIGERQLTDAEGNAAGALRWVSTIVATKGGDGDDTIALNQVVYTLPNGTIHANGQMFFETFMNPKTQPESDSEHNKNAEAVIGGTGAYARSEGEIVPTFTPGKPSKYVFKLHCD